MNQCAACGKELAEEFCSVPRQPCPFCGAMGRNFSRVMHESIAATAEKISWTQTRPTGGGDATLTDEGRIGLRLTGRPPRNEEESLAVSARLVRHLNASGANWSDPAPGTADVDAVSTDKENHTKTLSMQVVRSSTDAAFWQMLGRLGAATKNHDVEAAGEELIEAVRKKAAKYPVEQRNKLTLVLDAGRTPNHTFRQVHDLFARTHGDECRGFGFASTWVVGAADTLVVRLDS